MLGAAVQVRAKADAVLADGPERGEAPHLVAARVSEDRAVPRHEAVEPAKRGDQGRSRPQHEVIRVGEDDLGPDLPQVRRREALHHPDRPDRHERGRLDDSVRGMEPTPSRLAIPRHELEPRDRALTCYHVTTSHAPPTHRMEITA